VGQLNSNSAGRLLCGLLLLCVFLTAVLAHAVDASGDASTAALVNGTAISRGEFQRELERVKRQLGTKVKLADESKLSEVKREALENLITRELLYQESRKLKVKVDAGDVNREFNKLKEQYANEVQFNDTLKRMKLSEALLREQISRGVAIRGVINETIGARISVSDDEIRNHYDRHKDSFTQPPQVHLSHILVKLDAAGTAEQKKTAMELIAAVQKRLAAGEEFARLPARYSDDALSKDQGGDIGWFVAGQLAAELEKKVEALKVGEVSSVVEDRFGFHIIKVIERKEAVTPPLDEISGKIRGLVKQEKGLKLLQPYVKKLRDEARVEIVLRDEK